MGLSLQKLLSKFKNNWYFFLIWILTTSCIFSIFYIIRPKSINFFTKFAWVPASALIGIGLSIISIWTFRSLWKASSNHKLRYLILIIMFGSGLVMAAQIPFEVYKTRLAKIELQIRANQTLGDQDLIIRNITVDGLKISWFEDCVFIGNIDPEYGKIRFRYDVIEAPGQMTCSMFPKSRYSDITIDLENINQAQAVDIIIGGFPKKSPIAIPEDDGGVIFIFNAPLSLAILFGRLSITLLVLLCVLMFLYLLYRIYTLDFPIKTALIIFYSFITILLFPAIQFSLNTRFALIDDYNSFYYDSFINSLKNFIFFVKEHIINYTPGRYRPMFYLYNAITWKWFGENFSLHHLARLVLVVFIVGLSLKMMRLLIPKEKPLSYLTNLVFIGFFLFYPNHPEARLAPQETLLIFFYAIVLFSYAVVFKNHQGDILENKLSYVMILMGFLGMNLSKESSVFLSVIFIFFSFISDPRRWKNIIAYLPLWVIFGHTLSKIFYMSQHPELYGVGTITWEGMTHNANIYLEKIFLTQAVRVLPFLVVLIFSASTLLLFFGILKTITNLRQSPQHRPSLLEFLHENAILSWLVFLFISILTFFGSLTILEGTDLRFSYPLLYLMVLFLSLSLGSLNMPSPSCRRIMVRSTWIGTIIFILLNYYNFMYQFATQYYHRQMEYQVLNHIEDLLKDGKTVFITIDAEYEDKIREYFSGYLPKYRNLNYTNIYYVSGDEINCPSQASIHYITRKYFVPELDKYILDTNFKLPPRSVFFDRLESLATIIGPNGKAFFYVDGGTATMGTVGWQDYRYLGQPCSPP